MVVFMNIDSYVKGLPVTFGCVAGVVPWVAIAVYVLSGSTPSASSRGFGYGVLMSCGSTSSSSMAAKSALAGSSSAAPWGPEPICRPGRSQGALRAHQTDEVITWPPTNPNSRSIIHMNGGQWTFLSNHGHVLVSLARDPDTRTRDVAEVVGITERAVQQIVHDLVEHGYVEKMKVGRRNRYTVVRGAHLRHQQVSRVTLGEFLDLLVPPTPARSRRLSEK